MQTRWLEIGSPSTGIDVRSDNNDGAQLDADMVLLRTGG